MKKLESTAAQSVDRNKAYIEREIEKEVTAMVKPESTVVTHVATKPSKNVNSQLEDVMQGGGLSNEFSFVDAMKSNFVPQATERMSRSNHSSMK